jgi:hypothetical protein
MLTIIYDNLKGYTLPDGLVQNYVDKIINEAVDKDTEIVIGSDLILTAFRAMVATNVLHHDDVIVQWAQTGELLKIRSNGSLTHWPTGMSCEFSNYVRTIGRSRRSTQGE